MIPKVSPRRAHKRRTLRERKALRPESFCVEQNCRRNRLHIERCGTHAMALLDRLWSTKVRWHGACEAAMPAAVLIGGVPYGVSHEDGQRINVACGGPIQAAHGLPRTYRHTRHILLNGFAICAGHHRYFTSRPLEWTAFIIERLGAETYDELRRIALRAGPMDYEAALAGLA